MITINQKSDRSVNCGSDSILFNPFTSPKCGCDQEVVEKYDYYLQRAVRLEFLSDYEKSELNKIYKMAVNGGVNLICDCNSDHCHATVIKRLIESKIRGNNK